MKTSRKALFIFLALLALLALTAPVLSQGTYDDHDEFGEYDDEESSGIAGTAIPYIPDAEPVMTTTGSQAGSKYSSFDDEEFEGIQTEREKEEEAAGNLNNLQVSDAPVPLAYNYLVEIGSTVFLVAFAVNYMIGRKTNESIASNFARTYRDLFQSEFTVVGSNGAVLVKESQHTFRLNATGRANVQGIQVNLRLCRRQDLLARLYNQFWAPSKDLVDIQIAMNEDALDTIIFALAKNRDAREFSKAFPDLSAYTKTMKIPQETPKTEATLDSATWTALGEAKEITPLLLDTAIRTTLNRHKDLVRLVHITDQYSEHKEYKKVLQLVFYMPPADRIEDLRMLLKMTFHMIDLLAKVKVPASVKQSIEKARAKVITEEQKEALEKRQEELDQKKLEKRREKMKNMDANERAEFEEKERARKMNKRLKKVAIKA